MNNSQINEALFRHAFIISMIIGTLCRFFVLRIKDNQYPSRPEDYVEQIIVAALSASLGAIAFPALIDKEFSALTFLAVGIQQFQGLSQQEKITLENLEGDDLVGKGEPYINEIASTYEVRSYISLFSALVASALYITIAKKFKADMLICTLAAILGGVIIALIFRKVLKRKSVNDIADIYMAKITFDESILKVNDVVFSNIGLKDSRKKYLEKGMAIEIVPRNIGDFGTINDMGQQKAIINNIYIHLGMDKDVDERDLLAMSKTDLEKKSVLIIMIPLLKDEVIFMQSAGSTPILETSKGKQSAYKKKMAFFN